MCVYLSLQANDDARSSRSILEYPILTPCRYLLPSLSRLPFSLFLCRPAVNPSFESSAISTDYLTGGNKEDSNTVKSIRPTDEHRPVQRSL